MVLIGQASFLSAKLRSKEDNQSSCLEIVKGFSKEQTMEFDFFALVSWNKFEHKPLSLRFQFFIIRIQGSILGKDISKIKNSL